MEDGDVRTLLTVREIERLPGIAAVWTEIDYCGHRRWFARGVNEPWLLASDDLARFRARVQEECK